MSIPRFEPVAGVVDGVNTAFTTSAPYQPGTLAAFLNGQLRKQSLVDGWIETSPTTGVFDYKQAPELGDVTQAFYLDTVPGDDGAHEEICPINGILLTTDAILGTLEEVEVLTGLIEVC